MYRDNTSISDLTFVLCLFSCKVQYIMNTPNFICIFSGILIPMVLSPTFVHAWVELGAFNSNFLFFPLLVKWVAVSIYIVKYTRMALLVTMKHGNTTEHGT